MANKIKMSTIVEKHNLKNLTPGVDLSDKYINVPEINRPALQLTGFFEHFASKRIQIIGYVEYTFLEKMDPEKKEEIYDTFVSYQVPGIIFCRNLQPDQSLLEKAEKMRETLENAGFYAINSTIDKVAHGLGIVGFGLDTDIKTLSGGQRAKVMLAKMLLQEHDVLLLDEPTNFLDAEHIAWLTKFLNSYKGSFILVSHDFAFLNSVVNCICDIDNGTITRFNGSYESFVKQKEQKQLEYEKRYKSQQKEIQKLQTYIDKNIVRASTSKMAKSRQKRLDKIERLERPHQDPKPSFIFDYTPAVGQVILSCDKLGIGYYDQLVPDISVELRSNIKLAVTGFNGIGKSTFIKTVCGIIPALSGSYRLADNIKNAPSLDF